MANFILMHRHEPEECAHVAAAWRSVETGLHRRRTLDLCAAAGHRDWWIVQAADRGTALSPLPSYIADRTAATEIRALPYAEESEIGAARMMKAIEDIERPPSQPAGAMLTA